MQHGNRSWRGRLRAAGTIFALALAAATRIAPVWAENADKASTSNAAKQEALRAIPFDRLNGEAQEKVRGVVHKPSIYRRMPLHMVECDPDLHLFLVRNPEVVVAIWRLMGVTEVSLTRTGPYSFDAADGAGTVSKVEMLYGSADTHVFYGEGEYEGPLFRKPVRGRCVLLLQTAYTRGGDDRPLATNRLDLFLQIDQSGWELLARTLHPLVGKTADFNFTESLNFLGRLSQAAERNPAGVRNLSERVKDVEPATRARFGELAEVVGDRAAVRQAALRPPASSSRK